jgi:hypothetical protein
MRISAFEISQVGPLTRVTVSDLANVVVFAGPNGVGKTHINNAIIQCAQNPTPQANTWLVVEATNNEERTRWGKERLDTRIVIEAQRLQQTLQRNQRRNRYQSSVLNFDSDRAVRNVQSYQYTWDVGDPLSEEVGWNLTFGSLYNRYNDVRHSLFRMTRQIYSAKEP